MFNSDASIAAGAKTMFYCHDTYGLGHLRRTLTLANYLRSTVPNVSQLIVTGSPVANRFRFPQGTDYVKLPSVTKNALGEYEPRSLASGFNVVRDMRRDIFVQRGPALRAGLLHRRSCARWHAGRSGADTPASEDQPP